MKHVLSLVVFLSLVTLLGIEFYRPITAFSQDLGVHLLSGKISLQNNQAVMTNFFSYTFPTFPFINSHWLSQIIFYLIVEVAGLKGLLGFTTVLVLLSFLLLFIAVRKQNSIVTALGVIVYAPLLLPRTDIRPELISFFFVSIFLLILYTYRERYSPWIFLLIPLQLIWVNIHIYFIIGIILISIFFLEDLWAHKAKLSFLFDNARGDPQKSRILLVVLVGCCLVSIINPHGLEGALYPFFIFRNYGYSIQENQSIFFLSQFHFNFNLYMITVVALFTGLAINHKKTRLYDWLIALFFSFEGIIALRNISLFVFTTFILFVSTYSEIMRDVIYSIQKKWKILPKFSILCVVAIVILVYIEAQIFITAQGVGYGVIPGSQHAVDFFLQNHLKGPIFNDFDIGSYLDYRLYPKEKVFVDSRPEAYPADFFQKGYIPMQLYPQVFAAADEKYHFNTIIFAHTESAQWATSFMQQILQNNNWQLVYLDDTAMILLKKNTINEYVIGKDGMAEKTVKISYLDKNNTTSLLALASFFSRVGWVDEEIKMHQLILAKNPEDCLSLERLALLYSQKNSPLYTIYNFKLQSCTD